MSGGKQKDWGASGTRLLLSPSWLLSGNGKQLTLVFGDKFYHYEIVAE